MKSKEVILGLSLFIVISAYSINGFCSSKNNQNTNVESTLTNNITNKFISVSVNQQLEYQPISNGVLSEEFIKAIKYYFDKNHLFTYSVGNPIIIGYKQLSGEAYQLKTEITFYPDDSRTFYFFIKKSNETDYDFWDCLAWSKENIPDDWNMTESYKDMYSILREVNSDREVGYIVSDPKIVYYKELNETQCEISFFAYFDDSMSQPVPVNMLLLCEKKDRKWVLRAKTKNQIPEDWNEFITREKATISSFVF
ncbi:MAG: hypothetical protein N2484_00980 [Clostridia bacterium]|nr:hypothetical protein [Clostridia bacterium]